MICVHIDKVQVYFDKEWNSCTIEVVFHLWDFNFHSFVL